MISTLAIGLTGTFVGWLAATLITGGWKGAQRNSAELEKRMDVQRGLGFSGDVVVKGQAALRTKIGEVETRIGSIELESERSFVRKQEFQNVVDSFTRSIDSLRNDMNGQYGRINDKLDQVIQGKIGPMSSHR